MGIAALLAGVRPTSEKDNLVHRIIAREVAIPWEFVEDMAPLFGLRIEEISSLPSRREEQAILVWEILQGKALTNSIIIGHRDFAPPTGVKLALETSLSRGFVIKLAPLGIDGIQVTGVPQIHGPILRIAG